MTLELEVFAGLGFFQRGFELCGDNLLRVRIQVFDVIAAARTGADVVLLERANHLGGLSTGGLVIWIDRMSDWSGQQVIQGMASDLLDRLPKIRFDDRYPPPEVCGFMLRGPAALHVRFD